MSGARTPRRSPRAPPPSTSRCSRTRSGPPTTALTTGEGGMVTGPSAAVDERVRRLRFHGIDRDAAARHAGSAPVRYETVVPGFKYNLTDLQAALGIHQLARLDGFIEQRAK